jgi:hypothetical protein
MYETLIGNLLSLVETPGMTGAIPVRTIIDASFSGDAVTGNSLRIWLAMWGEIATNPALLKAHRQQYKRYRAAIESAFRALARSRNIEADIPFMVMMFISLVDGLWLEWCIDPQRMSAADARTACLRLLEPVFGPLDLAVS